MINLSKNLRIEKKLPRKWAAVYPVNQEQDVRMDVFDSDEHVLKFFTTAVVHNKDITNIHFFRILTNT